MELILTERGGDYEKVFLSCKRALQLEPGRVEIVWRLKADFLKGVTAVNMSHMLQSLILQWVMLFKI